MEEQFELIIIGGGPGGYVAAIRAAQLGMKVALVEDKHLGGICLNWGCIPTKALLKSAEVVNLINNAEDFGISVNKSLIDLSQIVKRSRVVSDKLSSGVAHLVKKNKITLLNDRACITSHNSVSLSSTNQKLKYKNLIIATGARARSLPGFEPDGKVILTYKEAMMLEKMPKKILVVGSGAIGIEFASFYNTIGSDVTIIETLDRILPVEDLEISTLAQKNFEKQGIKIFTSANLNKIDKKQNVAEVNFESKGASYKDNFDIVIMAVGIVGNIEDLGLEQTKVKIDKTHILTNGFMETDEPGIYAIGDVAGAPWLAHKASHEAIVCVEHIAGKKVKPINRHNIPGCTYSHPQIASIGITEQQAKLDGVQMKIGRFPFAANGKAIALGDSDGLIKVIFDDKTGELLGAHMIGPEVTELLAVFSLGKTLEALDEDYIHTIFAHPTLSEAIHEAVLSAMGRSLHA
jgi:dihydrolipoamide dehydrogenase